MPSIRSRKVKTVTVYQLTADANRYENLVLVKEDDYDVLIDHFNGEVMAGFWVPLKTVVLLDRQHRNRPSSDFPSLGGTVPVFGKRAVMKLEDLLRANGELLPLDCEEGSYYAFNVTTIADVLDEEGSEVLRFDDGGVMHIACYEFLPDRARDLTVFKLPQMREAYVYVTDRFVERVEAAGLTGFRFVPLWSSDTFFQQIAARPET